MDRRKTLSTLAPLGALAAALAVAAALSLRTPAGVSEANAAAASSPPILFASGWNRRSEIYVRAGDGTITRLTRNRSFDGLPVWSPNRKRIAFISSRSGDTDIYVMRADGTNVRRLTGGTRPGANAQDLYPAWSPDGRLIAFASDRAGGYEIFVMRADGSQVRRLTRNKAFIDDVQPTFSPDGRHLVFASNRVAYSNFELYRVGVADGRGLKRLTFYGAGGDLTPGDDIQPAYSPDGSRIAFVSDRDGGYAIWTMAADGTDLREVVRHAGLNHFFPRYSPDGRSLLYSLARPDVERPEQRLWTVGVDGSSPTELGGGGEADW